MVAEPTFDDALDWIAAREGDSVYIEVGIEDPTLADASFYPIALHATLQKVQLGEDTGHGGRGLAYLPFSEDGNNRLYLDPARITEVKIHGALKMVFHDTIYVGIS